MANYEETGIAPQLNIFPATEKDFEGIMAISGDVYQGMDYLPVRYHKWLQEPNRRTFVAKFQGQMVALESVCILDDGITAVVEGLRVSPKERGRGVAGVIQCFVMEFLKTEFPAVKVIRLTVVQDPPPAMLSQYRLLHSKAVLILIFKAGEVQEKVGAIISRMEKEGKFFEPPLTLEAKEVRRVFENETVIEKLLPARMLIQSWLPVLPTSSSLDYLFTRGITWMADSPQEPSFLSLGTPPYRVPLEDNCHRLDINLFGMDPRSIKMHFLAQLLTGTEVNHGGALFCFLIMEKPLFPTMDIFCEDIQRYDLWKEQLVLERNI